MRKDNRFQLRVSNQDLAKIAALAEKLNRSHSEAVRFAIDATIKQHSVITPQPPENETAR